MRRGDVAREMLGGGSTRSLQHQSRAGSLLRTLPVVRRLLLKPPELSLLKLKEQMLLPDEMLLLQHALVDLA